MSAPPIISVGDVIEVKFNGHTSESKVELVTRWGVYTPDSASSANYVQGVTAIRDAMAAGGAGTFKTTYLAAMAPAYTLDYVSAQRIGITGFYQRSRRVSVFEGSAGTYAGSPLTIDNPASTGVIERYTANVGRTEQGDLHIGPVPTGGFILSVLTGGYQAILAAIAAVLTVGMTYGSTGQLSPVFYRKGTKAAPTVPSVSYIQYYNVIGQLRSVRRRLGKPVTGT